MKGHIEIYHRGPSKNELIFEEHNMIVDGAGEHVVDILSLNNEPSSLNQQKCFSTAASAFGVKAMTLGSAKENFRYRTSRHLTATLASGTTVGRFYNLEPRIKNYTFSGTGPNFLQAPGVSALDNNYFLSGSSYLTNTNYEDYVSPPVGAANSQEAKQVQLADFEGWTVYSPVNDSTTPANNIDFASTSDGSGSVRYATSSLSLGLDQKSTTYIDLRASSIDLTEQPKAVAYVEQTFKIPASATHIVNGDFVDRKDIYPDGYNLSFWCKSEHASAQDLQVELRSSTGRTYAFSGNNGDHSRWLFNPTEALPLKVPKSADWKFVSIPVNFYDQLDELQSDITVRFLGNGTGSNFQSWHIASPSFGRIPGIEAQYTSASSYIHRLSTSALTCRLQNHGSADNFPQFVQKVSGLEQGKSYSFVVRYKNHSSTVAPKIELLQNNGIADDLDEYDYYNFDTCKWEQAAIGYPSTEQPYTLPLSTSETTETVGPINGVSANDVYIRWIHPEKNRLDVTNIVGLDIYEVKFVDNAHILYQGDYNETNFTEDLEDNTIFVKSPIIKNSTRNLYYASKGAVNVQSNVSGSEYYAKFDFKEDTSGGRYDITHTMTHEELAPLSGDYLHYAFKYQNTSGVNGIEVEVKVHDKGRTFTFGNDASSWINTTDYLGAWTNPVDSPGTAMEQHIGAIRLSEYFSPGIPIGRHFSNDAIYEFKITPYTSKDTSGNYTLEADSSIHLSDIRFYRANTDSSVSSFTPESPTPMDTLAQTSSVGPGKQGHFLNYISFSGADEYTHMDFEDIIQHGCYIPSGGIYIPATSFGYTNDGSRVNDMSGAIVGKLNDTSSVNSDGYILESRVARDDQVEGDASAGFVVSAIGTLSSTREVKYILTIKYEDWKFLDYYYGGIGSIGLWTLDREKTLDKYADETETASIDLYNLDPERNPIFKLFAKKVFFPGGLRLNEASSQDDYITIHWGITF